MRITNPCLIGLALATCAGSSNALPQIFERTILPLVTEAGDSPAQPGQLWLDGDELLVSAPFEDEILRFKRQIDDSWLQVGSIFPAWTSSSILQLFGSEMEIDGPRAAFAQPQYFNGGVSIYERDSSGDWQPKAILGPVSGSSGQFANHIALSGDCVMVSDHSAGLGGIVHVAEETAPGIWGYTQQIEPAGGGVAFGRRGMVFAGGQVLVSDSSDDQFGTQSGAVYVFDRSDAGPWSEVQKLTASDATALESFGSSIAISGETAVISAPFSDSLGNGSGAAYLFDRQADGSWVETQKLLPPDLEPGDRFGNDVSIRGELLLIAAEEAHDAGNDAGAVYVFQRQFGSWVQIQKILASDASNKANFGHQLFLSSDRAVVTPIADSTAYVFDPSLLASPAELSLASGGAQSLALQAGSERAGELYLVVGSATGSVPGLSAAPIFLPLNWDAYSALSLSQAGQGIFGGTVGFLDAQGAGAAQIGIPPGSNPALVGVELRHAFLTLTSAAELTFASNATSLQLIP